MHGTMASPNPTLEPVSSGDQLPLLFARVRIDGLKSRPELNGTFGKAVNYVEASGRYGVALESGKTSLKPANLSAAAAEDGNTCEKRAAATSAAD